MTLRGGESMGKETVHLKGGGTFTAKYQKGGLLRAGYWYGVGDYAAKGRYTSVKALTKASQDKKDGRGTRRGGSGGVVETRETWGTLLGLSSPKPTAPVKAGRVKPPKHQAQTQDGKKVDKWSISWRD